MISENRSSNLTGDILYRDMAEGPQNKRYDNIAIITPVTVEKWILLGISYHLFVIILAITITGKGSIQPYIYCI